MLTVVDPGWATRLVDGGRPGSRSLGVPVGGAADRASWMLGNALVGNPPDLPALEIALKGPILRADLEVGCVVFGAPFEIFSARQKLVVGRTFTLSPGEELHIGGTPYFMRAYLCIRGGISAPTVLGSRTGFDCVKRDQVLACSSARIPSRFLPADCEFTGLADLESLKWRSRAGWILPILPGGQSDWFPYEEILDKPYTVMPQSNRMGLRLQGEALPLPDREMLSEPVCPGTVQVTKDGQCIILGIDGQTIGGYPKIAHVIQAFLDDLGQMRPGDTVRFGKVELEDVYEFHRLRNDALRDWLMRCRVSLDG